MPERVFWHPKPLPAPVYKSPDYPPLSVCSGLSRAGRDQKPSNYRPLPEMYEDPGLSHMGFAELGEEAGEEGVVPGGAHALSFDGLLGAFELGKVESQAPQQGDVLRPVIIAGSGLVFVHGHIENPMQAVLHPPMGAGHSAEVLGAERGTQQVVGGFSTDLGAHLAGAAHAANGRQPRPGMALLQPS